MLEKDNESIHNEQVPETPESHEETTPVSNNEKQEDSVQPDLSPPRDSIYSLTTETFDNIKRHQNFVYALIGGLVVALMCAYSWAGITIGLKRQIAFMAIGVGLMVGFSVRFFGAGVSQKFGILGAGLSLFGCVLGNLLSQVGFIALESHYGYFETLTYLDFEAIVSIMKESFSPIDLLFYGFAIVEGYKFSFRPITEEVIEDNGDSTHFKYRMPLVIVGVIILSLVYVKVKMGVNGEKIFKYPSGRTMSKGTLKNSNENGEWTYYYENGSIQSIGSFKDGVRDGVWKWNDNEGILNNTGSYKNGIQEGVWISYYPNGNILDSVNYANGRMEGNYISRFENGNISRKGKYHFGKQEGIWEIYYENGQVSTKENYKKDILSGDYFQYFNNGQVFEEINYMDEGKPFIKNLWDKNGNQLVINGNGDYKTYFENGNISASGKVIDGKKVDIWKTYFENGQPKEEIRIENDMITFINVWEDNGTQTIIDGDGTYTIYYDDNTVAQRGDVKNGEKTGTWTTYYQTPKNTVLQEVEYLNNKANGPLKSYYNSGSIESEGKMVNDLQEGEWKWYHENGKISSSVSFKNNKKEGSQIMYNEKGNKVCEEIYKNGELINTKVF